jgi:oxygen-dependent protoporphyrinogen oxidase
MLLKPDAPAPRTVGVRVWPRAIPQFNVGHLDTLAAAKEVRREKQGFVGALGGGGSSVFFSPWLLFRVAGRAGA